MNDHDVNNVFDATCLGIAKMLLDFADEESFQRLSAPEGFKIVAETIKNQMMKGKC